MELIPSTLEDISQLVEWTARDKYHLHQNQPEWWLTGNGADLAFCLKDKEGQVCYVRLDKENNLIRIHTQFAPYEQVSKVRLVKGMLKTIPIVIQFAKQQEAIGLIFKSVSPSLIEFMNRKFGFSSVGNNNYQMNFEVA